MLNSDKQTYNALNWEWNGSVLSLLPKANLMLSLALASMLVWEHFNAVPSVKKFLGTIWKVLRKSS